MPTIANFRRQHDAAEDLVNDILQLEAAFGASPTSGEAFRVTMLFAKLAGVLRIHLAQEDRHLYPALMASGPNAAATVARQFFEEMGQLAPQLNAFIEKWRNPETMAAQWDAFLAEQATLFTALGDRIQRENDILYPLADKIIANGGARNAA